MKYLISIFFICISTIALADKLPALREIPSVLSDVDKTKFTEEKKKLQGQLQDFLDAGNTFNAKTAENQTDEELKALEVQRSSYVLAANSFNKSLIESWFSTIQRKMLEAVDHLDWTKEEKDRAILALNTLDQDGDASTSKDIVQIWKDVQARRDNDVLKQKASLGKGPGIPGAGQQTIHEDCAVFALANAVGVPYGVAAARATKLIADGEWRTSEERSNTQKTIEENGLMGGEVIMVAEALGKVEIVPSDKFAATLEAGKPVMVNLVPYSGSMRSGHEVVLTKTFQHEGARWFEMIDSNESGSMQRLYLNEKELGMMLKENGVSVSPEDNTVVKSFR